MGPRAAKTQAHECHKYLDPRLSLSQANSCQIPVNGIPRLQSNYPIIKTPNLTAIPTKGPNYPLGDSIQITRGLGGYAPKRFYLNHPGARGLHPLSVLTRTLWQVKSPPGDSIQITRGLRGYCRGPNTRVPKEVELITIKQ